MLDDTPTTWRDLLPWLPLDDTWTGEVPPLSSPEFVQSAHEVGTMLLNSSHPGTMGASFPRVPRRIDLTTLGLGNRARNCLGRGGCYVTAHLLDLSLNELLSIWGLGMEVFHEITLTLCRLSAEAAPPSNDEAPTGPLPERHDLDLPVDSLPDDVDRLREDLAILASFWLGRGRADVSIFEATPDASASEEVHKAHRRLLALTPTETLLERPATAAERLEETLGTLEDRERQILRARSFAEKPLTLQEMGDAFGVSRERVRQLETSALRSLGEALEDGVLDDLRRVLRDEPVAVSPLSHALHVAPALDEMVPSVDLPVWRVLDVIDQDFQIDEGWILRPSLAAAREQTKAAIRATNEAGVVPLAQIELPLDRLYCDDALAEEWLTKIGSVVVNGMVLTRHGSVQDLAVALLYIHERPLTSQEIIDLLPAARSIRSLRNALSGDERAHRVDRDTWALTSWGMPAYGGIRQAIDAAVEAAGGSIAFSDLVRDITERFSVAEASVYAYANSHPFKVVDGQVARSTSEISRKDPLESPRVYRREAEWLYRIQLNSDHFRGSGFPVPRGVADALDMKPGQERELSSRLGTQKFYWTGAQAGSGTIRRFLEDMDLAVGDEILLVLGEDSFDIERVPAPTGDVLMDCAAKAGGARSLDPHRYLALSLGLQEEAPSRLLVLTLKARGEVDLAEDLDGVNR